jgi:hypothetical protein
VILTVFKEKNRGATKKPTITTKRTIIVSKTTQEFFFFVSNQTIFTKIEMNTTTHNSIAVR